MRGFSMSFAGVMAAIAVFVACDSSDAAVITVNFDSIAVVPAGLTAGPVDLTGDGVFFSGVGNAVVASGLYGPNSLLYTGGLITMSTSGALNTLFDLDQLNAFTATAGTLTVNGNNFVLNAGNNLIVTPLITNVLSVSISSNVAVFLDNIQIDNLSSAAVPEPASAAFLGLGSLALVVRRLRRRSSVVA